jgi:hypothetical protein
MAKSNDPIGDSKKQEYDRKGNPIRSSLAKKNVVQILGDGESMANDKEIINTAKKPRGRPRKKNERPKTLVNMTLAQKKKFADLHNGGADFPAYNSYLGLPRYAVEWLIENADLIKKEIAEEQSGRESKMADAKIEAAELNRIARETGKLYSSLDEVKGAKGKRKTKGKWKVGDSNEKAFLSESKIRSVKWLASKYHSEAGPRANADIVREINRLRK